MKTLRIGVVGAGWISQEAFLPSIPQTGNCVVTAIVSGDLPKARKLAEFHGVPHAVSYGDYGRLLRDDIIDAVYIALPNSMHAEYSIAASKAGKHVLVEKPLAVSIAESEAMIAAAKASNTVLMTAYRLHNEPATNQVMALIRAGAIGKPRIMTSSFTYPIVPGNHRLVAKHWGGPLQDVGVYCINAARHIFAAAPIEAIAYAGRAGGDDRFLEADECISAVLRFPNGAFANFSASFGAYDTDAYTVIGTSGQLTLKNAYGFRSGKTLVLENGDGAKTTEFAHVDNFSGQARYFADCVAAGAVPVADGAEGLADMHCLLAIEASAATGRAQPIPANKVAARLEGTIREYPPAERKLLI